MATSYLPNTCALTSCQ